MPPARACRLLGPVVLIAATACGEREPSGVRAGNPVPSDAAAHEARETPRPDERRPLIVVLGDSLTAGLGLQPSEAYPAIVQERLDEAGMGLAVVNRGVSGDTSAGGLRRLDAALEGDVRILVLALGANDGLRGLPTDQLQRNLAEAIERARSRGIDVILAGMEAPPNFGRDYVVAFHGVYPALAKQYGVALVPFLLDGVAGLDGLNQSDGIHPTAEGARRIAGNIWPVLRPIAARHAGRAVEDGARPARR
jgi:acyl-CoA thioesterase-1